MIPIRKMLMPQTFQVKLENEIITIEDGLCLTKNQRDVLIDTLNIYITNINKLKHELNQIKNER
jgi:hypothetical protein